MQDEKSGASGGERQSRVYEGNPASSALLRGKSLPAGRQVAPTALTFLCDPELAEGEFRNDNALLRSLLKSCTNSTEKT